VEKNHPPDGRKRLGTHPNVSTPTSENCGPLFQGLNDSRRWKLGNKGEDATNECLTVGSVAEYMLIMPKLVAPRVYRARLHDSK
jgi:hypothetical protein